MKLRTFEWNGDFQTCRAEADAGKFDAELAQVIGQRMFDDYQKQRQAGNPLKMGWSVLTSTTFDVLWTLDARVRNLSEHEAKVLFLASSDVFQRLEFGRHNAQERRADLQSRMSRLSEMSAELQMHIEKLTDTPEEADALETDYQTLFSETLRVYAN